MALGLRSSREPPLDPKNTLRIKEPYRGMHVKWWNRKALVCRWAHVKERRPRATFCATVRVGTTIKCWWDSFQYRPGLPFRRRMERYTVGRSMIISPSSGWYNRITASSTCFCCAVLTSKACTSPAFTSNDTLEFRQHPGEALYDMAHLERAEMMWCLNRL